MEFSKYHGLGNDFVLVNYEDVLDYSFNILAEKLCDRRTGIGADGLIIVKDNPIEMIFYNQDGSRATMCGNGIRCFVYYLFSEKNLRKNKYSVKTLVGDIDIEILNIDPFNVRVNMGKPLFNTDSIPMNTRKDNFINESIFINGIQYNVSSLFVTTTNSVIIVDNFDEIDIERVGEKICNHEYYPNKTNVNFVKVIDEDNIKVKTFEKGVGVTLACGSGTTSAAVITNILNLTKSEVNAHLSLGKLLIEIGENTFMSGLATFVYKGVVDYENL